MWNRAIAPSARSSAPDGRRYLHGSEPFLVDRRPAVQVSVWLRVRQAHPQGELAETVRNPNYRATTPQFWRSLSQVGDRSTWQVFGTPFCGKGEPNQIIRVGHGAPVCAFNDIEVFGGAG
jgi:hypothetical protein